MNIKFLIILVLLSLAAVVMAKKKAVTSSESSESDLDFLYEKAAKPKAKVVSAEKISRVIIRGQGDAKGVKTV